MEAPTGICPSSVPKIFWKLIKPIVGRLAGSPSSESHLIEARRPKLAPADPSLILVSTVPLYPEFPCRKLTVTSPLSEWVVPEARLEYLESPTLW